MFTVHCADWRTYTRFIAFTDRTTIRVLQEIRKEFLHSLRSIYSIMCDIILLKGRSMWHSSLWLIFFLFLYLPVSFHIDSTLHRLVDTLRPHCIRKLSSRWGPDKKKRYFKTNGACTVVDLHTKYFPPPGPNSFIFTYIFIEKRPCWRSMPPLKMGPLSLIP